MMTTYRFSLDLNDTEAMVIEEALKMLEAHCHEQIQAGEKAPFIAWNMTAQSLREKLFKSATLSSTNNFGR